MNLEKADNRDKGVAAAGLRSRPLGWGGTFASDPRGGPVPSVVGMTTSEHTSRRIVVGVDGSPTSGAALRWALTDAVRTRADVEAVACWQWPATAGGFLPYGELDLSEPTTRAAQDAVAAAIADTPGADALTVKTHVIEGYPARILTEWAVGADLLVVGSRGHGALAGVLLGSVGLHCASHAPCPVLIVRADQATASGPADQD